MDLCLLNNDIPFDVLSRLPADTLVQLRSVSKGWERLITDPEFRCLQMKMAESIPISGYFFQENFEYGQIDVDKLSYIPLGDKETQIFQNVLDFLPEKVTILGSSNGLICCRSCISSVNPAIYICNPVTKEWISLNWENVHRRAYIMFSFDPSVCSAMNAASSYKLVRVFEVNDNIPGKEEFYFAFEIYDWEKKRWVKSKEICFSADSLCSNRKVFVKEVLYWLTDGFQVLMFDVEKELSWLISLPISYAHGKGSEVCLGESDGKLHCVVLSPEALLVWYLVDSFSSKWDLKFFLPLEDMEQENPTVPRNLRERVASSISDIAPWVHPLAYKDGTLFMRISNSAFSLDFNTRKVQLLCSMFDLGRDVILGPMVIPYSISLAPVANP